MTRMIKRVVSIACAIAVLYPYAADAACQRRDLQGLWDVYMTGVFFFDDGSGLKSLGFYSFCLIRVNAQGRVFTRAVCENSFADQLNITGQLSIRPGCVMAGEIQINDGQQVLTSELVRATLTMDKEMWTGIGQTLIGGDLFDIYTISGVKR